MGRLRCGVVSICKMCGPSSPLSPSFAVHKGPWARRPTGCWLVEAWLHMLIFQVSTLLAEQSTVELLTPCVGCPSKAEDIALGPSGAYRSVTHEERCVERKS